MDRTRSNLGARSRLPMNPLLPRRTSTILDATLKPSAPELVPEKGGPHVQPEVLSVPADTCRCDHRPLHHRARRAERAADGLRTADVVSVSRVPVDGLAGHAREILRYV